MKLPVDFFISSVEERKVYFFTNTTFGIPNHYHICIKNPNGNITYFVSSTTQFEKRKLYLDINGISYATLVPIPPDINNNFPDNNNCVDCNQVHQCSTTELEEAYLNDKVKFIGEISESHFLQIINGIHESPTVEEITKIEIGSLDYWNNR